MNIFFILSVLIFLCGSVLTVYVIFQKKIKSSFYIFFATVFFTGVSIFMPIYLNYFAGEKGFVFWVLKSLLISIHNSIRLFIVDGEYNIVQDFILEDGGVLAQAYGIFAAIIYVIAPMLTFGFILSIFGNILFRIKFMFSGRKELYFFSELNERSLTLARDLKNNNWKNRIIVFTNVKEEYKDEKENVYWKAKRLFATLLERDITDISFLLKHKKGKIFFYVMGEDEDTSILQSIQLIKKYKNCSNVTLNLFSNREEADTLGAYLSELKKDESGMIYYRINPVSDMVYNLLYNQGKRLFENAVEMKNGNKKIGAVVIGMGKYGTNMIKTLSWYLQVDGYISEINVFDHGEALKEFAVECPELLDESINGKFIDYESQYDIKIHSNIDAQSKELYDLLDKIDVVSYIFISLGSDELNIKVARSIRSWASRRGITPIIRVIIYHEEMGDVMKNMKNHKGEDYNIEFIDDLESIYKEKVLRETELQKLALESYKRRGISEEVFWGNWYNYRSSIASILRMKARSDCNIPGADLPGEELTPEQQEKIQIMEHKGWNAYTRSIGYVKGDKTNHLGKTHECLVPYNQLSEKYKGKDLRTLGDYKKSLYKNENN